MTSGSDIEQIQYLLYRTMLRHGASLAQNHMWVQESDRWIELVFALMTRVSDLDEKKIRNLVMNMKQIPQLHLLDIPALADVCEGRAGPDLNNPLANRILEFLKENGFTSEQANRGLTTICEVATVLKNQYDGKLQRYLRSYGELMLKELPSKFQFSALSNDDARYAFTYWLQNVLEMPISLVDENVLAFCKEHKMNTNQLFEAADMLGFNIALVDDLAQVVRKTPSGDTK